MKRIATYRDFVGELKVTYTRTSQKTVKINCSRDAADFIRPYFDEFMDNHEEFKIIHLNNANTIANVHNLSKGGQTGTLMDVRLVLRDALQINCQACVAVHNHPSGSLRASKEDIDCTRKLKKALALVDISLLDHIIITREDYYSLADEGLL